MKTRYSKSHYAGNSRRRMSGVGIIEVLIALVLVSFGVLGMAGLQLTGMKQSSGGYNRAKATLYAENLAARMRSNLGGVEAFAYSPYDSSTTSCATKPAPYCQTNKSTAAQACSSTEMAAFDLFSIACGNWSSAGKAEDGVGSSLANGRLQVSCDDTPCEANSNYTVIISWDENMGHDGSETTASAKRVQVRFNP